MDIFSIICFEVLLTSVSFCFSSHLVFLPLAIGLTTLFHSTSLLFGLPWCVRDHLRDGTLFSFAPLLSICHTYDFPSRMHLWHFPNICPMFHVLCIWLFLLLFFFILFLILLTTLNVGPVELCKGKNGTCPNSMFPCDSNRCIPESWRCDWEVDCSDMSDELECSKLSLFLVKYSVIAI